MATNAPPPGLDQFVAGPKPSGTDDSSIPQGLDDFIAPEMREEKYGTTGQQIITGLESAGSAATFGLSKGIERGYGVKAQDIRAREEVNPGASFAGSVAGLAATAPLAEVGAAGVLGRAGAAGAEFAGLGAEGAGLASRLGAHAVKAGIEGAIFQGGNEVGKMLLSDPNQTVQTAATDIGLAGLLGGAIGGGLGASGELWNATIGRKVGSALDAASSALNESTDYPLSTQYPALGPANEEGLLASGMHAPKDNIGAIQDAAHELGISELPPGVESGSKFVQKTAQVLSESGSFAGNRMSQEFEGLNKKLADESERVLTSNGQTLKTEAQVGREIKDGIKSTLEERLKPIESEYNSLKPELKKVPVHLGEIADVGSRLLDHEYAQQVPEMQTLSEKLFERIKNIKNLDDLKTQRSFIDKELNEAYRAGSPKSAILQEAKDALTELREKSLQSAEVNGDIAPKTLERLRNADTAYRSYKGELKQLGTESGLGSVNNARALLERFAKSSDESMASKVFDLNDINQLKYFKEKFPKEFELARRYKLKDIYEKSLSEAQGRNGRFETGKFLSQISDKKLNPEARAMLFESGHGKISAIRTLYQTIPERVNPSGTGSFQSFSKLFTPAGLIQSLTDEAKYALLKAMPHIQEAIGHAGNDDAARLAGLTFASSTEKGVDPSAFKQLATYIGKTISGENLTAKATSAIFKAGQDVLPSRLIPDDKDRKKLDDKLKDLQANNSGLFNVSDKVGHYLPDHGTAVAQVASTAVNYLNSLRPVAQKSAPLDPEPRVPKAAQAKFDRALDVAQQPLIVLQDVKNGTVTSQDMMTFHTIYPALYDRVSQKLTAQMVEHVRKDGFLPYKTKIGLSLFLGEPVDSSLKPASIMAAQPTSAQQAPAPQGQGKSTHGSMKDLAKLAQMDLTGNQARAASRMKT